MKRLSYSFMVIAAVAVAFAQTSRAQLVPRTVLLEEGTNWSCGPCAQANPYVESFLKSHGDSIIQISYHPNWPGPDDPMYLNDVNDNQGRVSTYYGISGVPTIVIDGKAVATASYAFDSAFRARSAKLSPLAISVARTQDGSTVTVNVTVKAVADISAYKNLKLRVVAVEQYVDTLGHNTEKRFMNPMRQMLPNLNGTSLTLQNGEQKTFTFTYDFNDAYRPDKMYEVAFVQSDASKEVLQAASTLETFALATPSSAPPPIQILSSDHAGTDVQVRNTTSESLTFSADYRARFGSDWSVSINAQNMATLSLNPGETGALSVSVLPGKSAFTSGDITVSAISARGDTMINTVPAKFIAPDTKIAFVDVTGSDTTMSGPTWKALTAAKYRYVPLMDNELTQLKGWDPKVFSTLIIQGNKWIITGDNKAAIASYLAAGGRVLIHGGEIAYGLADATSTNDRDIPFLEETLHADYVQDVASTLTVHGVSGDPISSAFASQTIKVNQISTDGTVQPDVITAANGATPIFYYGTGTTATAALRWDDGNSKLVYLAFGLQNLSATNQKAIINAAMNWLGVQAAVPVETLPLYQLEVLPNSPNPFRGQTTISYTLPSDDVARLAIMDTRGVEVAVIKDGFEKRGYHTMVLDASGFAPGTYFCVLRSAAGSTVRAVTIE